MTRESALRELLAEGVDEGVFPWAAAWIAVDLRPAAEAYAGGADTDTRWDLASLTKPLVVASRAMEAVARGALDLDAPVICGERRFDWRRLLAHRSGLPAWDDLPAHLDTALPGWRPGEPRTVAAVRARFEALAEAAPRGEAPTVYSDLGYILLGWELERLYGRPLATLGTEFRGSGPPPAREAPRYAPTGYCPRRSREKRGEVDDLNAWALGGAAGHAGLFATAGEVGRWALDLARAAAGEGGTIDGGVVREFWSPSQRTDSTWVLGWDTPSAGYSSAGSTVEPGAVGHLGFTGTSVWIEPERRLVSVLLTNRVAFGAASEQPIREFRPRFHDRVREILGL